MAERGQRTTIRFGTVAAEVSLLKTSGKPTAAQHETKTVELVAAPAAQPVAVGGIAGGVLDGSYDPGGPPASQFDAEPMGEPTEPGLQRAALESGHPIDPAEAIPVETGRDPVADPAWADRATEPQRQRVEQDTGVSVERPPVEQPPAARVQSLANALAPESAPTSAPGAPITPGDTAPQPVEREYVKPETRTMQGVHRDDGEWIDLTERFEEVDRLTRLDAMHVVATIDATAIPRERVRDAHYIAIADPKDAKVLALLWRALREERRAAAVKWTKRTAQALGIIVARGTIGQDAHLVLLELEFAENMRAVPRKAVGSVARAVAEDEVEAARELVRAFEAGPSALAELHDDRLVKRAELLERAREGTLEDYTPPVPAVPDDLAEDGWTIASALDASATWVREHATA